MSRRSSELLATELLLVLLVLVELVEVDVDVDVDVGGGPCGLCGPWEPAIERLSLELEDCVVDAIACVNARSAASSDWSVLLSDADRLLVVEAVELEVAVDALELDDEEDEAVGGGPGGGPGGGSPAPGGPPAASPCCPDPLCPLSPICNRALIRLAAI